MNITTALICLKNTKLPAFSVEASVTTIPKQPLDKPLKEAPAWFVLGDSRLTQNKASH